MIRYKGALYDNIYLKNGYSIKQAKRGDVTSISNVQELHDAIYRAVYFNDNFRYAERNIFELTDKGWELI